MLRDQLNRQELGRIKMNVINESFRQEDEGSPQTDQGQPKLSQNCITCLKIVPELQSQSQVKDMIINQLTEEIQNVREQLRALNVQVSRRKYSQTSEEYRYEPPLMPNVLCGDICSNSRNGNPFGDYEVAPVL